MRISVSAGYWSAGPPPGAADLFEAAERIGIDQIWTAEAYGSDAWTPLAWWGSRTERIKLGTAVSQLSARPPVTLAMTAMTMDHLTQGRVLLGIGCLRLLGSVPHAREEHPREERRRRARLLLRVGRGLLRL